MDAPLNEKIDRTLKRKAARKKNDSNYMPVLSLHQQVLALVKEANSKVPQERHVTPRSALIVMNRALASLSSLSDESRDFAVLKDVSRFLNVATKTSTASKTDHADLLVAGHPLSALNASISAEEFLMKNARWIAADPSIDESIRPLVASAHAATPGSIEREHAFARLNANKTLLASYFKVDNLSPIVAAFGDGNSSAARRARVALQWRDRKGRWVEMGRGANFSFRMPGGSVAKASGVYVGVNQPRPGENPRPRGLIQVSGDKNLPDGIYAIQAGDVETYAARITPAQLEKAGVSSKVRVNQNLINTPSRDELVAARLDSPTGWKKKDDNTFNSDDNYTVKGGDGEYTLYRQNEDGSLGEKVGEGANWADINDLANGDQAAYDAIKGQDSSAQQEQVKARLDIRTAHNAEFDRLEELVDSGVDQNGNKVPAGWEGIVKPGRAAEIERRAIGADRVLGEEGLPSVEYKKAIAYDYDTDPVYAEAGYDLTGKFAAYDKRYDSWEEAEADIPRWIKAEEDRRGRELTPLAEVFFPKDESFRPSGIIRPMPAPERDFDKAVDMGGLGIKVGDRVLHRGKYKTVKEVAGDNLSRTVYFEEEFPGENSWLTVGIRQQSVKQLPENAGPETVDADGEKVIKLDSNRVGTHEFDGVEMKKVFGKWVMVNGLKGRKFGKYDTLEDAVKAIKESRGDAPAPVAELPTAATGKEIYERRMAGDSLDKVAKDLGIPREEVRRLEAEYGRTLDEPTTEEDLVQIPTSTLDALNERMSADSTGEYNAEDVTFGSPDIGPYDYSPGSVVMYPDAWEPGDKIIGRIDQDGFIEWESDAQYDKYADKVREALRGIGDGPGEPPAPPSGPDDNQPFDMAVAQRFIDERFAESGIDVVGTTREGRNSYMILSIPEDKLEDFKLDSGFDDFEDEDNFKKLPDGTYKLYTDFPELNANLDNPIDPEDELPTPQSGRKLQQATEDIPELSNSPVDVNNPFQVAVSQQFIKERVAEEFPGVTLEKTVSAGRNTYMVLRMPTGNDAQEVADAVGLDQDVSDPEDVPKLGDNTYAFYIEFSELNSNLDSPVPSPDDDEEEPPTPPSGGSGGNTPGSGFSDYVIDLASGGTDPDKDLQERLDEDVEELAVDFMEKTYEDAGDVYELSEDIKDNKPEGMSDKEFIDDAAAQMRKNLEAIVDSAIEDRKDFVESGDAEPVDFDKETFINIAIERYKELVQAELDSIREDDGDGDGDGDGPDEPPSPPTGGTPPKTPSPSTPSAPGLFNGFNVPDGAFKLNTASYEPEGRVDEESKDFTDDPQKLATRFTPQDLVAALSEALVGTSDDAAIAEILNANVDDAGDIPGAEDMNGVDIPRANMGQPSGAGRLEFNAGEEYVPMEALYNAVWEAGLDPNRVVANIYDSVNGNNDNLNKLIDAQGGVPSAEEARLVDDIVQEIRQLKDASAPEDSPVANEKQTPSPDPLPGSLIENIPVNFDNPDYYIPNPESYIPSQPDVDENGYTDNPEILSADYEVADLIEQMLSGITDGSGAALLTFDNITVEVPIEAIRDAIQYQNINTNQILLDLKKESNDMSDTTSSPALQAHSQMVKDLVEQSGNTVDSETADKIRDAINEKGLLDWSEANDAEIIDAITEVAGPGILEQAPTPAAERRFPPTTGERQAPIDSPENVTPQFVYPGPRESGYSANNTILDSNGVGIGAGSRVQALSDGRAGTIVAVQNIDTKSGRDADYARIRFDDGTTAVRSARQIFGIDAGAPEAQGEGPGQLPPARRNAIPQDPVIRLNEPAPKGIPVIAGNGDIPGVKLVDTPQDLVEFTNPDAKQSDYQVWGLRAPEIARAARDRATAENIAELTRKTNEARTAYRDASGIDERNKAKAEYEISNKKLEALMRDVFGVRQGTTFGSNGYTIKEDASITSGSYPSGEIYVSISFRILDNNGVDIGGGGRTIRQKNVQNPDGTISQEWSASNDILLIEDRGKQKSGFAVAYNRYMEDWYIASGFKKIKVHAAAGGRWQGGLVWALNGFGWDEGQASRVPSILRNMLNSTETTEEEKQIIKKMQAKMTELNPAGDYTPDTVPTPLEIAQIGAYAGAAKNASWAGKRMMLKLDWYGVKNLDPSATEQRQALNYDQMRNARKRIESKLNLPSVSRNLVLTVNSNEFAAANPELAPYIDYIRDVFRSNRSLAVLSPGAKTALNRFTASQLMKGEDRVVSLEDIIKLRVALDAEFKADNPLASSSNFGVGNQLLDASMDDVRRNNVPGFTVQELGVYESGVNDTYMITHNDSGQIFFLKKDSYASIYRINGPGAEVQADAMLRASGVVAGYEARVSNVDPEVIVMQRAGVGVPLLGEPMTATNALNRMSVTLPDGSTVKVNPQNFMDLLHTPEDAVRVMLVDLIISNVDRHNGNLLLAVDGTDTGKIRILPIDHALSSFGPDVERIQDTVLQVFSEGNEGLYGMAMPVLTERLKRDELLALFRNEARTMMEGLNNPANLPTGRELDLIISNFGSLDAYRQKIQERIDALLQPGGEGHQTLLNVLKPSYWSQR